MIIEGVVVEGRRLGRKLGFPTANIVVVDDSIESGVYMSKVTVNDIDYRSITNIGVNPTVGEVARRAESYILDFEGELYGQTLRFELISKLRDEVRFESVEKLREQIARDIDFVVKSVNF